MIIAHLPAGYITAGLLLPFFRLKPAQQTRFFFASMAGAIAPDLDMFYFHLIDHARHHHHTYFTHYPIFWAAILLAALIYFIASCRSLPATLALIFALGGMGHMLLDTITGDIWWLKPWVDKPFSLATVKTHYQPWWTNFILHPSFLIEILLTSWAGLRWKRRSTILQSCTQSSHSQRKEAMTENNS